MTEIKKGTEVKEEKSLRTLVKEVKLEDKKLIKKIKENNPIREKSIYHPSFVLKISLNEYEKFLKGEIANLELKIMSQRYQLLIATIKTSKDMLKSKKVKTGEFVDEFAEAIDDDFGFENGFQRVHSYFKPYVREYLLKSLPSLENEFWINSEKLLALKETSSKNENKNKQNRRKQKPVYFEVVISHIHISEIKKEYGKDANKIIKEAIKNGAERKNGYLIISKKYEPLGKYEVVSKIKKAILKFLKSK